LRFQALFIDTSRVVCLKTGKNIDATFHNGWCDNISIAFVPYLVEDRRDESVHYWRSHYSFEKEIQTQLIGWWDIGRTGVDSILQIHNMSRDVNSFTNQSSPCTSRSGQV
jgi:hypothetical protein